MSRIKLSRGNFLFWATQIHFKCSSTLPPKLLQLGDDSDDYRDDDGDYNNDDQELPLSLKLLQLDGDDDDDRAGDGDDM